MGQAMDISWHRDFYSLPSLDEYDRMCRLKTGCLARLAAVLGVLCSGVDADAVGEFLPREFLPQGTGQNADNLDNIMKIFGEAAEQLGVGFQIMDDVKNLVAGNPGKKRGDDIVEGKKSLPVLLYLHRYPEKREFAARCFAAANEKGIDAPEVEEFICAINDAGIPEEAREKGMEYIQGSRKIFSSSLTIGFNEYNKGRDLLTGLIDMLC